MSYCDDFTDDKRDHAKTFSVVYGVGVVGALAGLLLGGPVLALGLAAVGTGAAVVQSPGTLGGDIARSVGQLAVTSFDKAIEIEREHEVVKHIQSASNQTYKKILDFDKDLNIVERGKAGIVNFVKKADEMNRKHKITENIGRAVLDTLDKANRALDSSHGRNILDTD